MKHYINIVEHYQKKFEEFGDTHLGVDWPNLEDLKTRYKVMLGLIREKSENKTLLDFGCGNGMFIDYIKEHSVDSLIYSGLDLSDIYIDHCKLKFPDYTFYKLDIINESEHLPQFDYIIMNGVFTEKINLSYDEMLEYFKIMIKLIFPKCRIGIAFNVMCKHVDWEREDLFHLPFDTLGSFLCKDISRNFVIHNEYGLYEYTTYVYK